MIKMCLPFVQIILLLKWEAEWEVWCLRGWDVLEGEIEEWRDVVEDVLGAVGEAEMEQ